MTIANIVNRPAENPARRFRLPLVEPTSQATSCPVVIVAAGLVRRLLRADLVSHLFDFAAREQPVGEVTLGAAVGWLPEISVRQAVSLFLRDELARQLEAAGKASAVRVPFPVPSVTTHRAPACPPLFHPAALRPLIRHAQAVIARLSSEQLQRQAESDASVATSNDEQSPLTDLVLAWSRGELQQIVRLVHLPISAASRLPQAVDRLRVTRFLVEEHAAQLVREAAVPWRSTEQRQAAGESPRPSNAPVFPPLAWVSSWWPARSRKTQQQMIQAGRQYLLVQCQRQALEQLSGGLRQWEFSLQALFDSAACETDELDRALVPPFPNLVPQQSPHALRTLLGALTDALGMQRGQTQ